MIQSLLSKALTSIYGANMSIPVFTRGKTQLDASKQGELLMFATC